MITTIALDLDNTLLNSDKQISPQNLQVLKQLHQQGRRIVLCTGRPIKAIQPLIKQLELLKPNDYSITFNGGLVQQNASGEILARTSLKKDDVDHLFHFAERLRFPLDAIDLKQVYSILDLGKSGYEDYLKGLMPFNNIHYAELPSHDEFGKVVSETTPKMVQRIAENVPNDVAQRFHVVKSRETLMEFLPHDADKSTGLKQLLDHFGEDYSNLMAFGDEANDLGMLKVAEVGVAMDNGIPPVKAAANASTLSNDEDGVAVFLKRYFKL